MQDLVRLSPMSILSGTAVQLFPIDHPVTPNIQEAIVVPLSVTLNGGADIDAWMNIGDTRASALSFQYFQWPFISALEPSFGPSDGGTEIDVILQGPIPSQASVELVRCRFRLLTHSNGRAALSIYDEVVLSVAKAQSMVVLVQPDGNITTSVTCISPPIPPGTMRVAIVDVSLNGGVDFPPSTIMDNGTEYSQTFTYMNITDSKALASLIPSSGPSRGGSLVTIQFLSRFSAATAAKEEDGQLWCAFGDTLVSTIPADYPGNNTSGEEASIIDDSIWNPVVISCVSPPILDIITHSDPILPHTVPLEVSFNGGVDFTKGMGSWTYDMDVMVSTLLPATGPVGGGTLVHVEGGPFPANREISCRFRGLPPTKATRLGNDALMCESPELQGVPEKQTVHLASMAYTPAVSCIKVNAAIPSPERHSISTSSLGLADEVQLIQLLWSDIDEVQSISLGQDLVAPRIISLYTAVAENQPTIIDISVLARAANPTLLLSLDALGGEDGGISDTWNITVTGYSGSFSLEWEGLTAELIPYDAESNLLQAMLNAAWFSSAADSGQQGVLVSKDISSGGSIINSWQVTMPSQMGGTLGPIVGYETPGPDGTGIDSVLVTQLTTGSVQEIQKVSALVDPSLGGSFTLSSPFGGWTTGLIPINAEASNLRSHLENTPGIGSVSVSKSVSDTSWFITFLELPGNVPLMSSGGDEIVSVTEVRNGTSFPLSGGVDVSFQGHNPIHIETIDSEEDVISAIESFPGLNNVQVVRSPASGEGLSGGVQFAITIDEFDQEMVIPMLRSYWTVDETGLDGSNAHASIEVENEGTAIAGSFTIKRTITQQSIVLSTSEEKLETIPLKYDSTEHEIEWALDTELGLLNATCERKTEERHTKKGYIWTCVIAKDVNVPEYSLNIDGAGLLGLEAVGNVQWQQSLAASEIQAVSAIPSTSGSFTLTFDGVTTQPLPYNATAGEVEAALRVLPTTSGYITVSRATKQIYQTPLSHEMLADLLEWPWLVEELDQDVVYDAYEWLVTFHGQIGPQDLLKANYEDIVPVKSIFPSDTDVSKQLQEEEAIVVRRVRMGVGEQLGGTWHVTYDGNPSPPIPWNASSHDVEGLLGEIANVSVKDVIPQPVYDGTVTEIKWLTERG